MAESTAPQPDLENELIQMRPIIGFATFAAEAHSVLARVDLIAEQMPHVGEALSGCIPARSQWSEYADMLAPVLDDLHDRLGLLMGRD